MIYSNALANLLGSFWTALMAIAFIPSFITHLGIEAYGLIGFFGVLQVVLNLFESGMATAVIRSVAPFSKGTLTKRFDKNLFRSFEIFVCFVGTLMAIFIFLASDIIAKYGITYNNLDTKQVEFVIKLMGCIIGIRFLESLYRSSIIGMQRQVLFNFVNATLSTVRWVGAFILIAFYTADIEMFFLWQVLISVLAVFIFRYLAFNILPKQMQSGSFSIQTLLAAKQYVGAMYSLSVLGIILSQFDKIVLSFSIEMSSFGYYTVASTVAALLFNLAAPITNAFFPRLCELKETGETLEFSDAFHKGAQLVSIVCGTGSFCLLIYSNEILFLWLGDKNVVEDISPLLKLLVIGNLINVVTWIPYQTQYAHGWTSLALKTNLIAIVVFIPTAIVFVLNFGAKGVIVSWIGLNIYYLFLSIPFMFSRILKGEAFKFYMSSILFPLGAGFFTMMLSSLFFDFESGVTGIMFKILICTTLSLVTSFLASGNVLTDAIKVARGVKG